MMTQVLCVDALLLLPLLPHYNPCTSFNITRGAVEAAGVSPQQAAWSL